jgi:hypothetical protein
MSNELDSNYKIFHRDTLRDIFDETIGGKRCVSALYENEQKYYKLINCITYQEPYIVVVSKDVHEISKSEFENILLRKS